MPNLPPSSEENLLLYFSHWTISARVRVFCSSVCEAAFAVTSDKEVTPTISRTVSISVEVKAAIKFLVSAAERNQQPKIFN